MIRCPIQEIAREAGKTGTPFLVIGGYAVLAHGYTRTTEDLDLITPNSRRLEWIGLLKGCGLSVKNESATFLQFNPNRESGMKLDLMFVTQEVFNKLDQAAVEAEIEGTSVKVVALLHLIALKCHALQHGNSLLRLKDMDDLIQLILINRLDLNEPELRATIVKHGNAEIHEKLQQACAK